MRQPRRAAGTRVSGNGARGTQGVRRGKGVGPYGLGSAASRLFGYMGSHKLERLPKAFTDSFHCTLTTR
jgi:hypothetical protein